MPSFAELRAKAEAAASTARDKTQALSSSSSSSASSKYTPSRPAPAPKPTSLASSSPLAPVRPPPSRTASSSSASPLARNLPAPPPSYEAVPFAAVPARSSPQPPTSVAAVRAKPFSRYDADDKRDMFAALDLFFESRFPSHTTATALPPNTNSSRDSTSSSLQSAPASAPTPPQQKLPPTSTIPVASTPLPPSAPLSTRPTLTSSMSSTSSLRSSSKGPSYPPPERYSSSALALSHYILSSPFSSPWFADPSSPMPPPLATRSDHQSSFSWQQRNTAKHFIGMTVFGDASVAWYRISWDVTRERDPAPQWLGGIGREARYRPVPSPWDGARLYSAHEVYGPRVAAFARDAVARGVPVARGECWDLAHEALVAVARELAHSRLEPFVSVGRTHGQLVFWASADDPDHGRWYGGDAYVRAGDIVEWRSVRIREVGMAPGSYSILGDPDHTAVIVGTGTPLALPDPSSSAEGGPSRYSPASLASLTVVEQSVGHAPTERTYDLAAFSAGEVWIYRPCGLEALVGVDRVEAVWPSDKGVESWQVGELE